ncbi:hypothetical protein SKAU_G00164330 [Synaphobranchus kaupii]|uniref:Reverse transcriptase domain-containing protein n=1 Tax=Synaphobranchus kaupii TaxID=118154 RepID=A0A9Q1FJA9_SYNKA|nr:hypothetical protein SKAU_G00164330 [Synaphobranchus kaupii]
MEAVVRKQLQQQLLSNNLISNRQFGFRPGHNTADLLNILSQKRNNTLDQSYEGSVLGPLLFLVFIDDLVEVCQNVLFLYADDSTLFAPIRTSDDTDAVAASLNRDLSSMKVWADKWKVTFEPNKCLHLNLTSTLETENCQQ